MVTRNQSPKSNSAAAGRRQTVMRRGGISIQMLVILVPVLFGFMGFAVDLGRLYLVKGELNQAASAMAMAAASQLNGTLQAPIAAANAAQSLLDDSLRDASRYNFGSIVIGQPTVALTSTVDSPALFATAAEAIAAAGQQGATSGADGTTARHVTINMNADAPLLFWSLLTLGQSRHVSIAATAVAGVSAPLCSACAIQPFAIAAANSSDSVNFGFVAGTAYTFGEQCTGTPTLLTNTTARANYLIIDRYDTGSALLEDQQMFRIGAQGTPPASAAFACSQIGATENVWATTIPVRACAVATVNTSVQNLMCGVSTRFTTTIPAACSLNPDFNDLAIAYPADTNTASIDDYTAYDGNNRRVITVPVVDALSATASTMTVLGFRQFLLNPTANIDPPSNDPTDGDGRFIGVYLGTVLPVSQGRFDGGCGATSGPGKVVLHQ